MRSEIPTRHLPGPGRPRLTLPDPCTTRQAHARTRSLSLAQLAPVCLSLYSLLDLLVRRAHLLALRNHYLSACVTPPPPPTHQHTCCCCRYYVVVGGGEGLAMSRDLDKTITVWYRSLQLHKCRRPAFTPQIIQSTRATRRGRYLVSFIIYE